MQGIVTIPNRAGVDRVDYHPDYSIICSEGNAPFYGTIDIAYRPDDKLLEFHSFDAWLGGYALKRMTIEDLCRLVFNELNRALGDIPLRVIVHARTTVHAPASALISQGDLDNG